MGRTDRCGTEAAEPAPADSEDRLLIEDAVAEDAVAEDAVLDEDAVLAEDRVVED